MTIPGDRLDAAVAEAVAGSRDALREVLETIRPIVVRYIRARLGTAERVGLSADDVAQEVCLAAIQALPRYQDQGRPFLAFVYGIAAHKVADAHRAAGRNRSEPTDQVPERYSLESGPEQMALQADAASRMNKLLETLPDKQREILILRIGWLCRAEYEWSQHVLIGKAVGLSEEEIDRISAGPDAPGWTEDDAALVRATDELHRDAFVSDATWAVLAKKWSVQQLMDVVFAVGQYNLVSMALNTLGVQLDEGLPRAKGMS